MAKKLNLQAVLASSFLYILSSKLLLPVLAQDQFPFEFDRRCRTAVDCVFEPQGSSDRVYLDCSPDGYCSCANYRLIADVPAWNLQWDPGFKQCSIAEMGPCGKDKQLELSCAYGLDCIKARCRAPEKISSGNRGDWCYDDIDCQDSLKCTLVSYQFQPVRRCMDRASPVTTTSSPSPPPTVFSTVKTATVPARLQCLPGSTDPRCPTARTTQSTAPTPAEEPTDPPVNYDEEIAIEVQQENITKPTSIPSTTTTTNARSNNNNNSANQGTQSRNSNIKFSSDGLPLDDDLVVHQVGSSGSSNFRGTFSHFLNVSIIVFLSWQLFGLKL